MDASLLILSRMQQTLDIQWDHKASLWKETLIQTSKISRDAAIRVVISIMFAYFETVIIALEAGFND